MSRQDWIAASAVARRGLLARRSGAHWRGRLSSSALSTALAAQALALTGGEREPAEQGLAWLRAHHNADGGWGDTPGSPSNLPTTMLGLAAFKSLGRGGDPVLAGVERWLDLHGGSTPEERLEATAALYGQDRTFAVPIQAACALAGIGSWRDVPDLPFELAVLPRACWGALNLRVVSYALPALIAVGGCIHRHRPSRRLLRRFAWPRVLRRLEAIQPAGGGFLEAVPLTAFVAMTLATVTGAGHPVVGRCRDFLLRTRRADGSWPIDSDLACWLTSSAIVALDTAGPAPEADGARTWLAATQRLSGDPSTGAAPGAWAWTDLPGGVPDADDTAGAVLALAGRPDARDRLRRGQRWLLDLQNADGGWPTFCRGWGHLPFDRSSPDITAHALRALAVTDDGRPDRVCRAVARGLGFLGCTQRADGSWIPLWFGDQWAPERGNPVLGTARVLRALEHWAPEGPMSAAGRRYLEQAQNPDGGWGGAPGVASYVETTALAVSALAGGKAAARGADWLSAAVADGRWLRPRPIGLYFASLWYDEELYPPIWTVEALGRALLADGDQGEHEPVLAAREAACS